VFSTDSETDLNTLKSNMFWAQSVNKWPLIAYLIGATFCLTCSATCHLCFVHSNYICDMVAKLDYWGIAVLGLASAYPKISYKFACGRLVKARWIFVSIIIVLCGICMFLTLKPAIV